MADVRVNGKAYDSGDVSVLIDGIMIDDVKEITYATDQEHQVNHSLRNDATSWSRGKITHTCSITLYMAAIVAIEKASGGNLLPRKPFLITVTYANEDNMIVVDVITAKFQSQGREVNGDMGLSRQFDLFTLGIKYNVG
jgi:hypothetical protein